MKLIVFICVFLTFFEFICTFCIYNNVTEGAEVHIEQEIAGILSERIFHAKINTYNKKCCHFSNKDCSPNGKDDDPTTFIVGYFKEGSNKLEHYRVGCTTGGAITLFNRDAERIAACAFANKTAIYIPLELIQYSHVDPI